MSGQHWFFESNLESASANNNNNTGNSIPVSEANIGVSTLNEERYIVVLIKFEQSSHSCNTNNKSCVFVNSHEGNANPLVLGLKLLPPSFSICTMINTKYLNSKLTWA